MQCPDSLDDAGVHRAHSLRSLQSSKKQGNSTASGCSQILKGSKRANALVGTIGNSKPASTVVKNGKDLHRSLSLPGGNISGTLLTSECISEPENSRGGLFGLSGIKNIHGDGEERRRKFREISQAAQRQSVSTISRNREPQNGDTILHSEASNVSDCTPDKRGSFVGSTSRGFVSGSLGRVGRSAPQCVEDSCSFDSTGSSSKEHARGSHLNKSSSSLPELSSPCSSSSSAPGATTEGVGENEKSLFHQITYGSRSKVASQVSLCANFSTAHRLTARTETTSMSTTGNLTDRSHPIPTFSTHQSPTSPQISQRAECASNTLTQTIGNAIQPLQPCLQTSSLQTDRSDMTSPSRVTQQPSIACIPLFRPRVSPPHHSTCTSSDPVASFSATPGTLTAIPSPPSHVQEGDTQEMVDEEDQLLPTMCFATDDRVTSLTATACGSYVVAGFASGAVKLYEMLRSGNTDLEDRYGYVLGHLNSSGVQGSLRLHVDAGRCVAERSGPDKPPTYISHVFAGALLGSTTIFIADIQSLQRLKRKRGFITMAGGGVKTFAFTDLRLRGFCSLAAVYYSHMTETSTGRVGPSTGDQLSASTSGDIEDRIQHNEDSQCEEGRECNAIGTIGGGYRRVDCPLCGEERGYIATYRLLSGKGYGNFTVWEVVLLSQVHCPLCSALSTDAGENSRGSTKSPSQPSGKAVQQEVTIKYSQSWQILCAGSVNAPSMDFSRMFISPSMYSLNILSGDSKPKSELTVEGVNGTLSQCSDATTCGRRYGESATHYSRGAYLEFITQGSDKDARVHQITCCMHKDLVAVNDVNMTPPVHGEGERNGDDATYVALPIDQAAGKPRVLKGMSHLHAVSSDGNVAFGGQDELVVYRMTRQRDTHNLSSSGHIEISEILTFSLTDISTLSESGVGGASGLGASSKWAGGAPSRRGGRHLRQIEEVTCTCDGQYALIRCSDNAVVVYSLVDIFGAGCSPIRTEQRSASRPTFSTSSVPANITYTEVLPASRRSWPYGYATLWYHADDQFGLKVSLSYIVDNSQPPADTATSGANLHSSYHPVAEEADSTAQSSQKDPLSDVKRWEAEHNGLRHPSSVLVLTAWREQFGNQRGKEGVLRAERLCPLPCVLHSDVVLQKRTSTYNCGDVIPIAKAGIGLAPGSLSSSTFTVGSEKGRLCWLCGSTAVAHWPDLPLDEPSDDEAETQEAEGGDGENYVEQSSEAGRTSWKRDLSFVSRTTGRRPNQVLDLTGDNCMDDSDRDDFVASKRTRNESSEPKQIAEQHSSGAMKKKRRASGGDNATSVAGLGGDRNPAFAKKKQQGASAASISGKKGTQADLFRQLQKQMATLEVELNSTREVVKNKEKECAILVRKFDKRFAKEMETRKNWNAEKRLLEAKILSLEGQNALMESRAVAAESHNKMIMDKIAPLQNLLGALGGEASTAATSLVPHQIPQTLQLHPRPQQHVSWGAPVDTPRVPLLAIDEGSSGTGTGAFCVVCQDNTADTILIPCGHLCLCHYHAVTMQAQGRLVKCPLCSKPSTGICRAVGINM